MRIPSKRLCRPLPRAGFSLVEVVLAVGVVSFALVAMMGLLSVGLRGSRESAEDTTMALSTGTAISLLRMEGFGTVKTNTSYASNDTTADFLFDADGRLQQDANGAPLQAANAESHYGCIVTRRTPPLDPATTNLIYLRLQFEWPLAAAAPNRQQRIVLSSLANYD